MLHAFLTPDHRERDQALHDGPEGHLPAWAMAQAQAEMNDDDA